MLRHKYCLLRPVFPRLSISRLLNMLTKSMVAQGCSVDARWRPLLDHITRIQRCKQRVVVQFTKVLEEKPIYDLVRGGCERDQSAGRAYTREETRGKSE